MGHLPTAHIAGVQGYFVNPLLEGGIVYWMPTFNFDDFVKYCSELRVTTFFSVPPIYMAIAKHPVVKDQFRHMRAAVSGAAPLSQELQEAASEKLGRASLTQTWGLSETTGSATGIPLGQTNAPGSIGPLLSNIEMR